MGFTEAIASGFKNYVTFSGRACRSEYWFWTLFAVIASIVAAVIDNIATFGVLGAVVSLGLFLPGLAVAIRRLHDIDRTGWWILLTITIIGLIVLFIFAVTKGTEGPNTYGADPLAGK